MRRTLPRRDMLLGSITGGLVRPAAAQTALDPPQPLLIGVLSDPTGLGAALSGPPLHQAVTMAVDDAGPLPDGRPVAVTAATFRRRPDDALAIAQAWFDQGVAAIIDLPGATAARLVQAAATARGRTTLITGSVAAGLTGAFCSPLGSRWSIDTASTARALVGAVARRGARSWFLVATDSLLGSDVLADAVAAVEAAGGRVAGRARHPEDMRDYGAVADQIHASGAQAVGLCDITPALTLQIDQFRRAGLFDSRMIAAFLPSLIDLKATQPGAAAGLLTAAPFYWTQNDQARGFGLRFLRATGRMPDPAHAGAYAAVRHFLRAASTSPDLDAVQINRTMRQLPVYFFGVSTRLRLDGLLAADLHLLRVKQPVDMRADWDFYEPIAPVPEGPVVPVPAASIDPPLNGGGCRLDL